MKILIIGAGMYVTGRGGFGPGIVLAALAELSKQVPIDGALVVARSSENAKVVADATARINGLLHTQLPTRYQALKGKCLETEIQALCRQEHFDCAIVSTPDHLHSPPLRVLLNAGIPSLTVKPFVPTLAEAQELIHIQEQTDTYGAVEFHKRFDEGNLYAMQLINQGTLGKLLYLSIDYSQRIMIPSRIFRDWVETTNIFQYLGVHYVDLVYFMTGFIPSRLTAYGTDGILKSRGIQAFDSVHVLVEWVNPQNSTDCFIANYNTNWIDPDCTSAMSDQKFKIVGTLGRLECDQKNRGIELVEESNGIVHPNPYFSDYLPNADGHLEFQGYGYKSIACFVHDVLDLRNQHTSRQELEKKRSGFQQSLISTAVIDAVNQALAAPNLEWRMVNGVSAQ